MQKGVLRTLDGGRVAFMCPGCEETHQLRVEGESRPRWGFNGDYERPTFTPSVLVQDMRWVPPVTAENLTEWKRAPWKQTKVNHVCHSFVTDGQISFLNDCTHALAGQVAPIPRPVES